MGRHLLLDLPDYVSRASAVVALVAVGSAAMRRWVAARRLGGLAVALGFLGRSG